MKKAADAQVQRIVIVLTTPAAHNQVGPSLPAEEGAEVWPCVGSTAAPKCVGLPAEDRNLSNKSCGYILLLASLENVVTTHGNCCLRLLLLL
jgi:hypothetical protein